MTSQFLPDDKFLQAGLAAGMSATEGIHSPKPNPVPPELAGKNILPTNIVLHAKDRVDFPSAKFPVKASPLCVGAWPWGDKATWDWSESELGAVRAAWKTLYEAGINFIDTAQAYGNGRSEQIVGELCRDLPRDSVVIQTKYLGPPTSVTNYIHPVDAPLLELKKSLDRLNMTYVDIYLVHGPIHPQSIKTIAKGMAQCVEEGLARTVGVANYGMDDLRKIADELAKYNVPLAAHQVEFNILRRLPETDGEISECREKGIVFEGYSALAEGRLSGKYSVENPPPKKRRFSSYDMKDVEPVLQVLREIGQKRGKSVASVALNWNISKGSLPLVGIRNEEQAKQALDALGWRLSEDEVAEIDKHSFYGHKTVLWQQG